MISQFRATEPADARSISKLMQQVFGMTPDDPVLGAGQMDWKYWRPHPAWQGSRSFVMERNSEVIAHGSVVPLSCAWGDRRLKVVHVIDWVARPDCTGAGITLMKRIGQMVDGIFAAGGSDMTRKILPALGFRQIGQATLFALPVRPFRKLLDGSLKSWKPVARFARNLIWKTLSSSRTPPGWRVRRLPPQDLAGVHFPTPHQLTGRAVFERTVAGIADFLECPATPAEFYLVEHDGAPRGYFTFAIAGNQCRIAEAWVDSDRADDWRTLYTLAIRQAAANLDTFEIVAAASAETDMLALQQAGFKSRGQIPLYFLGPKGGVPDSIRYELIDGDGAYLYDGHNAFWT
jgi:hypothetical protein